MELREYFHLEDYSEETINRIIQYRMNKYKNAETHAYISYEEIAEMENMKQEDVEKILRATAIIWSH